MSNGSEMTVNVNGRKILLLPIVRHPVPSTSAPKPHLSLLSRPPNNKTKTRGLQNSTREPAARSTRLGYIVALRSKKEAHPTTKKMKPCQPNLSNSHGRRTK
ncbi:hypothetical protein Bca4012_001959 [Brassica carinata]